MPRTRSNETLEAAQIRAAQQTILNLANSRDVTRQLLDLHQKVTDIHHVMAEQANPHSVQNQIQHLVTVSNTLHYYGNRNGSSSLVRMAQGGDALSKLWSAGHHLQKIMTSAKTAGAATNAAGAAASSALGSAFAFASTLSMAFAAGQMLVDVFKSKKKKSNELQMVLQAIATEMQRHTEALEYMHQDMRELFSINFQMQAEQLRTMRFLFKNINELLQNQHIAVIAQLNQIENTLNQLNRVIRQDLQQLSLNRLREMMSDADGYINDRIMEDQNKIRKLHHRLQQYSKLGGEASLGIYSGANWLGAPEHETGLHLIINEALRDVSPGTLACLQGFLAENAIPYLPNAAMARQMINIPLWLNVVAIQTNLRCTFPEYIFDPEHSDNEQVIQSGLNYKHYLTALRQAPRLFEQLLDRYQEAKTEIIEMITTAITDVNRETKQSVQQRHPHLTVPEIDIAANPTAYATAWDAISEEEMTLSPGENIQSYSRSGIWGPAVYTMYFHKTVNQSNPTVILVKQGLNGLRHHQLATKTGIADLAINPKNPNNNTPINIKIECKIGENANLTLLRVDRTFSQGPGNGEPQNISEKHVLQSYLHRQLGNGGYGLHGRESISIPDHHQIQEQITNEYKKLFLGLRKQAVGKLSFAQGALSVRFDRAINKLDAQLKLLKAYLTTIGCSTATLTQLDQALWNAEKIRNHMSTYLESATAETAMPHTNLIPQFDEIKRTVLAIVSPNSTYAFSPGLMSTEVDAAISRLRTLREFNRNYENLRAQSSSSSTDNNETSRPHLSNQMLIDICTHYAEHHTVWAAAQYHDPIPNNTKSTMNYRLLVGRLNEMLQLINNVNTALGARQTNIAEVTQQAIKLNRLGKLIHDSMLFFAKPQYPYDANSFDFLKSDAELLAPFINPAHANQRFFQPNRATETPPPAQDTAPRSTGTPNRA